MQKEKINKNIDLLREYVKYSQEEVYDILKQKVREALIEMKGKEGYNKIVNFKEWNIIVYGWVQDEINLEVLEDLYEEDIAYIIGEMKVKMKTLLEISFDLEELTQEEYASIKNKLIEEWNMIWDFLED